MAHIIDRRSQKHKSTVNRQRFLRRFKSNIKKAVNEALDKRSVTDTQSGEEVNIPLKNLKEPHFQHGDGGLKHMTHAGNKEFITGDKIKRPPSSSGEDGGSQANDQGEGLDDFTFSLSKEEFYDLFFEDLALPNLVKKDLSSTELFETVRAGYSIEGTPTNINMLKTLKTSMSRRIAARAVHNEKLHKLETALKKAQENGDKDKFHHIEVELLALKERLKHIPYIDEHDLRYNYYTTVPKPATHAVMFCLMDVSASMDERKKNIAKRFFMLLYLFLSKTYKNIEVVFIRHHTIAKEVTEEEFFYSQETGGTIVSSALELMNTIIEARYPVSQWNIYGAQASDGDNWGGDSSRCESILLEKLMPKAQFFSYIEITSHAHQELWKSYLQVKDKHPNFMMRCLDTIKEIYPVFRELFKRKAA